MIASSVDSYNSSHGPEPVTVVAEASGDYRLEVRANEFWRQAEENLRKQTASGRYAVWIKELREATPADRTCFTAKRDLGEQQKALDFRHRALSLAQGEARYPEAAALTNIGLVYASSEDKQKAIEYYGQALALYRVLGGRNGEAATLAALARVECDRDNLTEAPAQMEAALNITGSQRTKMVSPELRTSFLASKENYYEFYIDLELMKRFYQGMLKEGWRPAAALRAAQVAMWKEQRWEAPCYWAGFVVQGEWK